MCGFLSEHGSLWWHRSERGDGVSWHDAERSVQGALWELVHWQEERSNHRRLLRRGNPGKGQDTKGNEGNCIFAAWRRGWFLLRSSSISCPNRRRLQPCQARSCSWKCQWTTSRSRPTLTTSRPANSSGLSNHPTWWDWRNELIGAETCSCMNPIVFSSDPGPRGAEWDGPPESCAHQGIWG